MTTDPLADAPELCRLGAVELAREYRRGGLSPVEVTEAVLARAEAVHEQCNAFVAIHHAGALRAATAAERRWRQGDPLGPLDGVPATIKDIVWMRGFPLRAGSRSTPDEAMPEDAPSVRLLHEAGVVPIGVTTTPEFGWKALGDSPLTGITRNPWDPALTPGGSSAGAAVAAASGAGVLHLGTDGGGSIRIPAAFTGIVGHKPTFGRVPAYPASPFGTLAHIGPMTRSVADAALLLNALSARDARDWHQNLAPAPACDPEARLDFAGLRIGLWMTPPAGEVDPEIAAAVRRAAGQAAALGAAVAPVSLPGEGLEALFHTLWFAGAAARLAGVPVERRQGMDPGLLAIAAEGARLSAPTLALAHRDRAVFGARLDALLAEHALLLSPAVAVPPFAVGEEVPPGSGLARWTGWAGFSYPVNLGQHPACTLPCGRTAAGLPIGLQIVGPRGADDRVLAAARTLEEALPGLR